MTAWMLQRLWLDALGQTPRWMAGHLVPVLVGATLATACGDKPAASPATAARGDTVKPAAAVAARSPALSALPTGPLPHAPWAARTCAGPRLGDNDELACVGGVPITRAQFDAAWQAAPPASRASEVLQSLVDAEVMAQAAARDGGWRDPQLAVLLRQRMAATLLDRHVATITPAAIADSDIAQAFHNPQIQPRYDHVDAWYTIDAQLLCCSGDPRQCAKREEVQSCIDNLAAQAQAAYAALRQPPPQSPDEMWARTRVLGDRLTDLVPAEVHFYYDKAKAHDQQKGYDVVVREFAEAVVSLQPGQLHPPVRSPFGWHIPYLSKVDAATHKTWRDADVRAEIAAHIVDPVRQREAQRFSFEAMRRHDVQFFYDRLEPQHAAAAAAAP